MLCQWVIVDITRWCAGLGDEAIVNQSIWDLFACIDEDTVSIPYVCFPKQLSYVSSLSIGPDISCA